MSALWSTADSCIAQITLLFNNLIGSNKQALRDTETKRFCSLEVDQKLELARTHDRQVGGLFAFENSPSVYADLVIGVGNAGSVAHQSTGFDLLASLITSRQR